MRKKLAVLGITLLMLFSLAACYLSEDLADYKVAGKMTIQAYADEKGQANFCADGWNAILNAVTQGKEAVKAATSKGAVDSAVIAAKKAIDGVVATMELKQGFYSTDDKVHSIRLYGENQFSLHITYISLLTTGTYKIECGRLILEYVENNELVFEIRNDELVFIGANKNDILTEEGLVNTGTIFKFIENHEQTIAEGNYVTDDGLSSITLLDGNKYIFNRHISASYRPTGNYSVVDGKLALYIDGKLEFVFEIKDGLLIFLSGQLAESFVEVGTVFKLDNQ